MTDDALVQPASAEPSLDQQIIAASRELIAAQRARPREQARIDAARTELERLNALRDTPGDA